MQFELLKLFAEIQKKYEKCVVIVEAFNEAQITNVPVVLRTDGKQLAYKEVMEMLGILIEQMKETEEKHFKYIESLRNEIKRLKGEQE